MQGGQSTTNSSGGSEQHLRAQEFKTSGNFKFNKCNYKGAIVDYKKGLMHELDNPEIHANLSAAYIHLEKFLDAEEHAIYSIQLKPTFYKGYVRAAKAAHGRGMTTLALKRVNQGLDLVTDQNGIKELNRLKTQYTAYLSLKSNAEREMDFSSDRYLSEDEDEERYSDNDNLNNESLQIACPHDNQLEDKCSLCVDDDLPQTTETCELDVKDLKPDAPEEADGESTAKSNESSNTKDFKVQDKEVAKSEKREQKSDKLSKKEVKNNEVPETTEQESVGNEIPLEKKDISQEKEPDSFLELCKVLTKDPNLRKHVQEFKENLKSGGEAFLNDNFRKAAEYYKAAKERVGLKISDFGIDDREFHVIKYAHCAALINIGTYDDIVKAIQMLLDMEIYEFSIPAIYILLARAYCKLNRFKTAQEPLEKVQDIIDNHMMFPKFLWPGTSTFIQETTVTGLKNAVKELSQICRMSHKPTATCRFDHCLKTSTHILPSEFIYLSDPDFAGFVRMICEEKCNIEFHIACWKANKESIIGVGKINDKDFLGRPCPTMDCVNSEGNPSVIVVIEIIDADGQVKSANKLDPKTIVDSKKSKKKKCKLDDREKAVKPKKTVEKKVREVKKPTAVVEEEEDVAGTVRPSTDTEKVQLTSKIESLKELRTIKVDKWDPRMPFYGRNEEMEKWMQKCETDSSNVPYMDYSSDETVDVKDAKEFIFSYFMEILKVEGPLKQADVEELWKQVAEDFCNIKVVLPNLQSMCDLLIESTCFCQLEDYICLAGQLDTAYDTVKTEVVETVNFLMSGSSKSNTTPAQPCLPDLVHQPKTSTVKQYVSASYSEDESSESEEEYNSDPSDSAEETDEEASDAEEVTQNSPVEGFQEIDPTAEEFIPPKLAEVDGEKFSLQKMLDEMSRVKNMFMQTTSEEPVKTDKKDLLADTVESALNETFETAHGGSQNASDNDKELQDDSAEENKENAAQNDDVNEAEENVQTATSEVLEEVANTVEGESIIPMESETPTVTETGTDEQVCDKASQSELQTEERQMQTVSLETRDSLSQTKESDVYKELNEKMQELTKQIDALTKENNRLTQEVGEKEALNKEIKQAQNEAVAHLQEENKKSTTHFEEVIKTMQDNFSKEQAGFKKKEEKLVNEVVKMKDIHLNLVTENKKLNVDVNVLSKQKKDLEANLKTLEKNLKVKVIKSQQAQLLTIKTFWESQIILLGKRCVEKISEMHSWFSLLPSGEVEELPSWKDVRQITLQWGDISTRVQQIQAEFQTKYKDLEARLSRGEEVDNMDSLNLPTLPDEPNPLPLDKIHKEITDKHTKKISELTQLVANQQLEIEKIKESSQQMQQIMSPFQVTQRMQTPLTTAFGSLAFQYPYTHNLPSQFGSSNVPTIPPPDITKIGVTKPVQADVQTLLKESTSASIFSTEKTSAKIKSTSSSSFLAPPLNMPPPPPVGVAHNLLKASSTLAEKKDKKLADHSSSSKAETSKAGSSRESTPVPASTPNPTPEKVKKKKKSKAEVEVEVKAPSPVSVEASEESDTTPWTVLVNKKTLAKHTSALPVATSDYKLKNKKKLLEKLHVFFPKMPIKDLDEIVKLVREQNNGSLSGLSFNEIEVRVDRFIKQRNFQKTTTMGLAKFSTAWGPVKQQEAITWTNLELEECTICLELMGNDRTKVDCNHEFHTKCLRKWLKEKSVCPLCNKFTTMPDEFPAL